MEVIIQPDAAAAARLIARLVADALRRDPAMVLGLATGCTMERVYDDLVAMHDNEGLDFSLCSTFNLDEYIGLPPDHPQSYRYYMNQQLFERVDLPFAQTHLPDGMAEDLKRAARDYEQDIEFCGGIDLQLLGIGIDGHIGFNEPLSALRSRTRDKALTPDTLRQNAPLFGGDVEQVPRRALTMGVGTVLEARRILLLATGESKADIVAQAVEGPVTSLVSASVLQWHPACTVIVDEAAAGALQGGSYYRWIWEHEPEWLTYHEKRSS